MSNINTYISTSTGKTALAIQITMDDIETLLVDNQITMDDIETLLADNQNKGIDSRILRLFDQSKKRDLFTKPLVRIMVSSDKDYFKIQEMKFEIGDYMVVTSEGLVGKYHAYQFNKSYKLKEDNITDTTKVITDNMYGEFADNAPKTLIIPETGIGDVSDGYHTFNELYNHRAILFNVICHQNLEISWKSKLHHDGTMFDNMFIVGMTTPYGQVSYHYDIDPYWDMFVVNELDKAPEFDGHTPKDVLDRLYLLGTVTRLSYNKD